MKLTADSGSTKTTWLLNTNGAKKLYFYTQGINPFHMDIETMESILEKELLPQLQSLESPIDNIEFYGAGCTVEKSVILKTILQKFFPSAKSVIVGSDMLGAAKALFNNEPGIACILGTGSNSCLYDGEKIVENISPMGYILGDEGSGAVIGKTFLNCLYKGGHRDFITVFESETGLTLPDIINKVYRGPLPNRFLASLCPFIHSHLSEQWIEEMVIECFRKFFENNIKHYNSNLNIGFVGSVAFYFEKQLRKAAEKESSLITKIMKEPL
jgi:N-acetylglucosamine kinase-like BadF-type ATPase